MERSWGASFRTGAPSTNVGVDLELQISRRSQQRRPLAAQPLKRFDPRGIGRHQLGEVDVYGQETDGRRSIIAIPERIQYLTALPRMR